FATLPVHTEYQIRYLFSSAVHHLGFSPFSFALISNVVWIHIDTSPNVIHVHRPLRLQKSPRVICWHFIFRFPGELESSRPVPFRLTPSISEFLTWIGVSGPFTASMIAAACCL